MGPSLFPPPGKRQTVADQETMGQGEWLLAHSPRSKPDLLAELRQTLGQIKAGMECDKGPFVGGFLDQF